MPHSETFTYDLDSVDSTLLNISYVRLRITDTDSTNPIFVDAEIKAALVVESYNLKRTAAYLLETIAANEVLVQKVIKILQLSTDGAKVAAELRANAKLLRDQANSENAADDATFDIAEWIVNDFNYREHIIHDAMRGT